MIVHFRHRGLRRLHERGDRSGVAARHVHRIRLILQQLDVATGPQDIELHSLDLHPLRGDLAGHWALRVSGNWRITFRFEDGDVRDVDLTDYH
ncbi:MAG: type II toxin-antitoxin system RelE/ParE family toxin [Chloroflexi bacterium]|nr:type II toxin-antitoxin system RelE/ParE family toxin [Chloroflexota bacterium]